MRLKHGYYIKCREAIKDAAGNVVELRCTYDPESGGGTTPDGRIVKGTLHWVSAAHAVDAEVRLYDYLFTKADPNDVPEGQDFTANLNPNSLTVLRAARWSPAWPRANPATASSSCARAISAPTRTRTPDLLVFNRTVGLRDTWGKVEKKK